MKLTDLTLTDLLPKTYIEKMFYMLDGVGLGSLGMAWASTYVKTHAFLETYILFMTALTITITVGVKVYNLSTTNKKNKKI